MRALKLTFGSGTISLAYLVALISIQFCLALDTKRDEELQIESPLKGNSAGLVQRSPMAHKSNFHAPSTARLINYRHMSLAGPQQVTLSSSARSMGRLVPGKRKSKARSSVARAMGQRAGKASSSSSKRRFLRFKREQTCKCEQQQAETSSTQEQVEPSEISSPHNNQRQAQASSIHQQVETPKITSPHRHQQQAQTLSTHQQAQTSNIQEQVDPSELTSPHNHQRQAQASSIHQQVETPKIFSPHRQQQQAQTLSIHQQVEPPKIISHHHRHQQQVQASSTQEQVEPSEITSPHRHPQQEMHLSQQQQQLNPKSQWVKAKPRKKFVAEFGPSYTQVNYREDLKRQRKLKAAIERKKKQKALGGLQFQANMNFRKEKENSNEEVQIVDRNVGNQSSRSSKQPAPQDQVSNEAKSGERLPSVDVKQSATKPDNQPNTSSPTLVNEVALPASQDSLEQDGQENLSKVSSARAATAAPKAFVQDLGDSKTDQENGETISSVVSTAQNDADLVEPAATKEDDSIDDLGTTTAKKSLPVKPSNPTKREINPREEEEEIEMEMEEGFQAQQSDELADEPQGETEDTERETPAPSPIETSDNTRISSKHGGSSAANTASGAAGSPIIGSVVVQVDRTGSRAVGSPKVGRLVPLAGKTVGGTLRSPIVSKVVRPAGQTVAGTLRSPRVGSLVGKVGRTVTGASESPRVGSVVESVDQASNEAVKPLSAAGEQVVPAVTRNVGSPRTGDVGGVIDEVLNESVNPLGPGSLVDQVNQAVKGAFESNQPEDRETHVTQATTLSGSGKSAGLESPTPSGTQAQTGDSERESKVEENPPQTTSLVSAPSERTENPLDSVVKGVVEKVEGVKEKIGDKIEGPKEEVKIPDLTAVELDPNGYYGQAGEALDLFGLPSKTLLNHSPFVGAPNSAGPKADVDRLADIGNKAAKFGKKKAIVYGAGTGTAFLDAETGYSDVLPNESTLFDHQTESSSSPDGSQQLAQAITNAGFTGLDKFLAPAIKETGKVVEQVIGKLDGKQDAPAVNQSEQKSSKHTSLVDSIGHSVHDKLSKEKVEAVGESKKWALPVGMPAGQVGEPYASYKSTPFEYRNRGGRKNLPVACKRTVGNLTSLLIELQKIVRKLTTGLQVDQKIPHLLRKSLLRELSLIKRVARRAKYPANYEELELLIARVWVIEIELNRLAKHAVCLKLEPTLKIFIQTLRSARLALSNSCSSKQPY